jgi:hypothetical protein
VIFKYPDYFRELAMDIGKARSLISKNIYKEGTKKYRGNMENEISARGIIGELIIRHLFYEKKIPNKFNPIIDDKPIVDYDCMTEKSKYDIKVVKEGGKFLMVNKEAHDNADKNSKITDYLFVRLLPNYTCSIIKIKKQDVYTWEEYQARYTKVYRKKINE